MKNQDAVEAPGGPTMNQSKSKLVKRLAPLIVLVAIGIMVFALDLDEYLTFESLKEHRAWLVDFVARQGFVAVLIFVLVYMVQTAVSLPGAAFLTMIGGFLFGAWVGAPAAVIGATIGATLFFLIIKLVFRSIAETPIGEAMSARAGPAMKKMETGFQENAFSYLLVLRLIPLFPFWLVNLVAALLGVGLVNYVLATLIGIIPGSIVFTLAGAGLGSVFESNEEFSVDSVLTPEIVAALVGLALLAILPVAYKKIKARKDSAGS